jgi:hypothetical protein
MATAAKSGSAGINPEVKNWIDNVIVPTLVKEYLATERTRSEAPSNFDASVIEFSDIQASPEEVQ